MSRRGIHPLLMGIDKPKPKHSRRESQRNQPELTGYESAQRKRFLRTEAEGSKKNQVA